MKKKYIIIGLFVWLFTSCIKDQSVYEFSDHEKINVTGIGDKYTRISNVEYLTFTPEVSSTDQDAEFEYLWGMYETNVQGSAPVLDTLAKTKDLQYLVNRPAKDWVLVYRVTNKNTGYSAYFTSTISVVTPYTRGWYVAKSDATGTDVDLFLTPETIVPTGDKSENVFQAVNGRKLEGKANMLTFFSTYKSNIVNPAQFANTRAFFIVTDKDAACVNINDFKQIRSLNNMYFETPTVKEPRSITVGPQAYFINNGGKISSIYNMSANTGQFGIPQMANANNDEYKMSKYLLTNSLAGAPYYFDELSSSFFNATATGSILVSNISNHANSQMSARNNNKNLLWMGTKVSYPIAGYAVFQDKTDLGLKILSKLTPSNNAFLIENDTLSSSQKLFNAEKYAVLDGDESMMYFSVGKEIYSRNLVNKFEQLQFTIPANEEVAFIRHRKLTAGDAQYRYNYIIIGTKVGSNYKIRMFNKVSGNLNATPEFTLEGVGECADVMYIAPNISEGTYLNTF